MTSIRYEPIPGTVAWQVNEAQIILFRDGIADGYADTGQVLCRAVPVEPAQGLDMPDGPGWWAWEYVGVEGADKGVSEVYRGGHGELIASDEPGGCTVDYYPGRTWYRLYMPWESPPVEPMPEGGMVAALEFYRYVHEEARSSTVSNPETPTNKAIARIDTALAWVQSQRPQGKDE